MRIQNHVDLYRHFRRNRNRLLDQDWLVKTLRPHCRIKMMGWRGSRLRIVQNPIEFAQFLIFAAGNSVRSYLEVGTSTGGSFMAMDAYLRAIVPHYKGAVGYDRTAKLRDFEIYEDRVTTIEFRHKLSEEMVLGDQQFDLSFIDACHKAHRVLGDFDQVRHNCRFVAFHDIVLQNSTVSEAWELIKENYDHHWEFIDDSIPEHGRCGIGIVEILPKITDSGKDTATETGC